MTSPIISRHKLLLVTKGDCGSNSSMSLCPNVPCFYRKSEGLVHVHIWWKPIQYPFLTCGRNTSAIIRNSSSQVKLWGVLYSSYFTESNPSLITQVIPLELLVLLLRFLLYSSRKLKLNPHHRLLLSILLFPYLETINRLLVSSYLSSIQF